MPVNCTLVALTLAFYFAECIDGPVFSYVFVCIGCPMEQSSRSISDWIEAASHYHVLMHLADLLGFNPTFKERATEIHV